MKIQKGIAHVLLVLFLVSQFQIGTIYADTQAKLETSKAQTIQVLDQVGKVVDASIDKIDNKIADEEQSERLREKEQEIKQYIEETQEAIWDAHTSSAVSKKVKEAEKVIVLKIVSWVTKYENVEDNIPEAIANTPEEKEQAIETIQDSLETKSGDYTIMIKTKYNAVQTLKLLKKFDPKIRLNFLYSNTQENYFELTVDENSLFKQEMLEDIQNGDIPESFLWIEIVKPEVFSIGETPPSLPLSGEGEEDLTPALSKGEGEEQVDLTWEQLNLTWWIQKYLPETYLDQISTSENKITVGVIDTGIDYNHPDLQGKVTGGYDFVNEDDDAFDDQWHGTHVAGTIWASINQRGIIGVNPYVELVPLKICNAQGFCPTYAVTQALSYAKENNIDILNMSLWGATSPVDNPICDGITSYTLGWGIVVAASGNSNTDTNTFVPGWCADAITVAAVDQNNQRASFSNYGTKIDISAPWVWIYSTYPNNQYRSLNGTSMATPHVVWFVSVLKTLNQDLTTAQTKDLLNQFQIPTYSETNKPIAHTIDVANIIAAINTPELEVVETPIEEPVVEEVIVVEEEIIEEPVTEEVNAWDDAEIVPTLEFIENQINKSQEPQTEREAYMSVQGLIGPVKIDFGNKETGVGINSVEEPVIEIIDIIEQTEPEKVFSQSPEIQIFNEAWELIDWGEINSIPENEKIEWTYVEWDFDINSIVAPEIDDIIQTGSEEEEEPTEVQEVFIDGAEKPKWVEINSISEGEDKYRDIEVQNADDTASGTTDEAQTSEPNSQWFAWFGLLSATQADTNWLVAEYLFDWNANDTGPNWFHGTIYSAQLTQGKDWVNNTAYNFDGQDDGITLNGMAWQITTWEFSVDMWVNVKDLNSNIWYLRDTDFKGLFFYGMNPYFRLGIDNNNRLALWQKVWGAWKGTTSREVLPTNKWIHLVATHNKTTLEDSLYIDGVKVNNY